MYRIQLDQIVGTLRFDDKELEEEDARAYAPLLVDAAVEVLNSEDPECVWDIINKFERLLRGNRSIETIITSICEDVRRAARLRGWDPRLLFKSLIINSNPKNQMLIVMDLDATIERQQQRVQVTEPEDIEDVVNDTPTPEQLQELEVCREREVSAIKPQTRYGTRENHQRVHWNTRH